MRGSQLLEGYVLDAVGLPVAVVEMPPLCWKNFEALLLHLVPQQVAPGPLFGCASGVVWIRPLGHFVVDARHLHLKSGLKIVDGEVHRTPSIVAGSLRRVGHKIMFIGRSGIPEYIRHVPGTVSVENQQTVA